MSYQNAEWVKPSGIKGIPAPFSKGYIDNAADNLINGGASPFLRNARLDGYSIIIRPGHNLFATLTAGSYPKGIGSYDRVSLSDDRIIVRHNQDTNKKLVSLDTSGNSSDINTSTLITSDARSHFTNGNDVIYHMNGVDTIGKLSGTTYALLTLIPASFAPKFSTIFNGAHWASGWSSNSNVVYKSVGKDYNDFTGSGSDTITMPEPVTGLGANDRTLFYFTRNTIQATDITDIIDTSGTLTYISRPVQVDEGSINHASIVNVGNKTFFVTPSNKIMLVSRGQSVNGFEAIGLSDRPYAGIDGIMGQLDPDQTDSFGYYHSKANCIFWHFKSNGSTFNDIRVVYDLEKDAFLIDDNKNFYGATVLNGVAYSISMLEPKVYLDEYAQDDEGQPISFEYRTPRYDEGSYTRKKTYWESRTFLNVNELAELKQEIYIDSSLADTKTILGTSYIQSLNGIGTLPVGTYTVGDPNDYSKSELAEACILRTKGNLNVKGKTIQFRFLNSSLGGKIKLTGLEYKVQLLPEIATNL